MVVLAGCTQGHTGRIAGDNHGNSPNMVWVP